MVVSSLTWLDVHRLIFIIMVTLDPPIPLPQGNVQVLPGPKTTTEGDVLLTWNTGQARTEAPTNYLTTGKRKASSTDIWRLPVDNLANLPITEDNSRATISMAQQRPNLEVGNSGSALGGCENLKNWREWDCWPLGEENSYNKQYRTGGQ